jgi:hypothetical protein
VLVKANGRTHWFHNQRSGDPMVFYNESTGEKYQLTITRILDGIVAGYVLLPSPPDREREGIASLP